MRIKPPKGTARAAQHRRTAERHREKLRAKPRTYLFRGNLPASKGQVGIDQSAFDALAHRVWTRLGIDVPVVLDPERDHEMPERSSCGHVESRQLRPDLRHDILNVCPISANANERMVRDLEFRAEAQKVMYVWIDLHGNELTAAFAAEQEVTS